MPVIFKVVYILPEGVKFCALYRVCAPSWRCGSIEPPCVSMRTDDKSIKNAGRFLDARRGAPTSSSEESACGCGGIGKIEGWAYPSKPPCPRQATSPPA